MHFALKSCNFSRAVTVLLERCFVGSFLRTWRCWLGNEWKTFHGHWQGRVGLEQRYTGKNNFPVLVGSVWVQLARHGWQFGRQAGISVGSLDRVQVHPVPSTAQWLVLLGFAKLAGAGQGQRAGSTSLRFGRAGQEAWLLPSRLSSTAGVRVCAWPGVWDTPDMLNWSHIRVLLVQNSPSALTEEGVTSGAPYLYGLNQDRTWPRPWAFYQHSFT